MEESHSPKRENGKTQKGEPIPYTTTNALTNLLPNNNAPTTSAKSVNEILLLSLSLSGLNEKQKTEASKKLAKLSPNQRDLAVQVFNKTVSAGGVKSSPMALLNQLVNLGLENRLEQTNKVEPIQVTPQKPQKPTISDKDYRSSRIEMIKVLINDPKRKECFLNEFNEKGYAFHNAAGGAIMKPDLEAAGLFD